MSLRYFSPTKRCRKQMKIQGGKTVHSEIVSSSFRVFYAKFAGRRYIVAKKALPLRLQIFQGYNFLGIRL